MTLQGHSIIGNSAVVGTGKAGRAMNPATGETLSPDYHEVSEAQANEAVAMAAAAFPIYRKCSIAKRAAFLRSIADQIEARGDDLAARGPLETGLPEGRIRMETGRTYGQLRLFASVVEDGSWVDARIDHADPDRQPIPKPDVRSMLQGLGPVAVFCASNFPLAFSVAGGDTASALAAGCPVVVKAHHSHPGVAEIVGQAVQAAGQLCGLPDGIFSLLYGGGRTTGAALVQHPSIKAVGFTGSLAGGRALMDLAAARPEPIPVYAEMGSLNPVFILPEAMAERGQAIAESLSGSVTLGVGQFCTSPGLVVAADDDQTAQFTTALAGKQQEAAPGVMLNSGIHDAYESSVTQLQEHQAVTALAAPVQQEGCLADPALFEVAATDFIGDSALSSEVFGPSTTIVKHGSKAELLELAKNLEGHLTATIHGTEADLEANRNLIDVLETKVGRLIVNGYPTGVEVCQAMVHGGPYPATADGRSTSVGTQAIYRFARPLAYQGFPQSQLPPELQDANPLGVAQMIDGNRHV
ncbi:MAG: aldehyde dehydrogenase family protein [Verrucomicrobiaceae bacterium]|nr:aldehyde dehydrogenase family protein [Verrucomicrobiaceae bacterium]